MATDRLPPRGVAGLAYSIRHYFGTRLGNTVTAARLRAKYGLDGLEPFSGDPGRGIAIVAIFKGEDEYLREWIEFHRIVGVDHFFLYDNGASASSKAILEPYIVDGSVTYLPFADFPEEGMRNRYGKDQFRKLSMQNLAYGDCARRDARRFKWVIKIDLDEFIYPLEPYASLPDAFARFERAGVKGFSVRALRFGPSGRTERSGLPVIESYSKRNPEPDLNWKAVGAGGAISASARYHGCHAWFYRPLPLSRHLRDDATADYVMINHYYIKSRAEYLDKIERHSVGHKAGKETADKWPTADAAADHRDEGRILRFLPALKAALAERGREGR